MARRMPESASAGASEAPASNGRMRCIQGYWVTVSPVPPPSVQATKADIEREVAPCCDCVYDKPSRQLHLGFQSEDLANGATLLNSYALGFAPQLTIRLATDPAILRRKVLTDFTDDWPVRWEHKTLLFKTPNILLEFLEGFWETLSRWLFGARSRRSARAPSQQNAEPGSPSSTEKTK
ncbi:hypothetical protein BESB_045870 [Besnoitia besnoiti]|uniref:Uncharacterized protein n=1 Tax=Besnoitia besnoiti TaxID=94643 RepID=A0A2A9MEI0_BESBE|nr:hypothetical protein BESB_045870 [Besnoitia besnoiti]PFH36395.1 hypothetical protein BESB_045870 [Besnoitia besnoiti]